MKLKIPPIFVFLAFGLLMYLVSRFLPVGYFDFFGRTYLIVVLSVMAMVVILIALIQFMRSKTSVDPSNPAKASKLISTGIYHYSRNPMYLGMLLLLLAWGLWLGNAFNTLSAAGFVGYMNKFQIIPEEEVLSKVFGKAYTQYCTLVRRWF